MLTPLPWMGSTTKGGTRGCGEYFSGGKKIMEGEGRTAGHHGPKTATKIRIASQRQRAIGQSVEGVIAVDDAGTASRTAGEFDRSFDTFGAGIRKKDFIEIRHMSEQPLREHARQRRNVELHEVRQLAVQHALQGVAKYRMVPPNRKNAKTAE